MTTLIKEDKSNTAQIYSLIALLTCLEVQLGTINSCLPIIRPIFTKVSNSKLWSSFTSTVVSGRRSMFSRSTSGNRSGANSRAYRRGERPTDADELRDWPSPQQALAPRFVDAKAANMMFSHHSHTSSVASSAPRPPPKCQYYQPERRVWEEKNGEGITVQRDWDIERGDSGETDRRLLREEEDKIYGRR